MRKLMRYKVTDLHLEHDNPYTIKRKLFEDKKKIPKEHQDVAFIIETLAEGCKIVAGEVATNGLTTLYGSNTGAGTKNESGDDQKKIDVLSNNILINILRFCEPVGIIASEEEEGAVFCNDDGEFLVSMDPLDGSGNIDCNVSIGTIFGIWKKKSKGRGTIEDDVLRDGTDMIASGYCVYGASDILVIAFAGEVNGFTYDPHVGTFILSHPHLKIPEKGEIYSINEGNSRHWFPSTIKYVQDKKDRKKHKSASLRYIGSMVSDVHRTLLYGGVFMYPNDKRYLGGKLRMLYECLPLSFLIETAGGAAISNTKRLLECKATELHDRIGIVVGSKFDVEEVRQFNIKYACGPSEEDQKTTEDIIENKPIAEEK